MPAVDHLVYAVPDLDIGVQRIADLTGVTAVAGGSHPGAGTRNALLSFDDDSYFEIISVDPDQPEPATALPFGVDPARPSRLAGFAVHPTGGETIEGMAEQMTALGLPVGPITAMSRRRPDGVELNWRLTHRRSPEILAATAGVVPFVIDWGATETPARSTPRMGRLARLRLSHPDPDVIAALRSLDLESPGEIVVTVGDPGLHASVQLDDGRLVELGRSHAL